MLLELAGELGDVDISFEGELELGVASFVDGAVDGECATAFDVALGGVEMRVAGDVVAFVDEEGEQDVLGTAALVGGDDELESGEAADDVAQLEERARAGIAFVAGHHGGPLAVAHGTGAGVGEAVDVDLVGGQLEKVVAGLSYPLFAFPAR